mmetsp:Transcript_48476/g.156913  ORF Transcript_48476/g.156913 Transcript_48476/m.156913 type:complete len:332 (+) Transcript_48476:654-1649(+)
MRRYLCPGVGGARTQHLGGVGAASGVGELGEARVAHRHHARHPHVVHLHQPVASLVVGNREEVPVVHRAVVKPALVARGLHIVSAQRGHVEGREGALLEEPAGPVQQVVQEQLHKPQVAVPSVHLEQHLRADGRLRVRTLSRGRVAVRHEPLRRLGLHHLDQDGIAELLARRVEAQHVSRKVRVPVEEHVRPVVAQHGGVPAPRVAADDGGDDALQRVVDHIPHGARLHRHLDLRMLAVCAVARLLRLPRRAERRPDPSGWQRRFGREADAAAASEIEPQMRQRLHAPRQKQRGAFRRLGGVDDAAAQPVADRREAEGLRRGAHLVHSIPH